MPDDIEGIISDQIEESIQPVEDKIQELSEKIDDLKPEDTHPEPIEEKIEEIENRVDEIEDQEMAHEADDLDKEKEWEEWKISIDLTMGEIWLAIQEIKSQVESLAVQVEQQKQLEPESQPEPELILEPERRPENPDPQNRIRWV